MARKRSGFGSVEQLASGRYRARYRVDGQWHNAPITFETITDARVFLDTIRTDLTRGAWKAPRRAHYSLDEYGTRWIAQRQVKASTRAEYESSWRNHVAPYLGHLRLDRITPDLVRQWNAQTVERLRTRQTEHYERLVKRELELQKRAERRGQTRTPKPPSVATVRDGSATAARAYRLLHSVFATAVEDELLSANPCRVKGAGNTKPAERPTLSLHEAYELENELPDRYRALAWLLILSGLRIGEAAALQRRDLNLHPDMATVTVRERYYRVQGGYDIDSPKSRAGQRTVSLPRMIVPILQQHLETYTEPSQSALVFTTDNGAVILGSYSRILRKALNAIGRADVRTHDLRHTGMTLAAQAGASLGELKHRMGQGTTAAAEVYVHATTDHGRRVAQRMDDLANEPDNVIPIHRRTRQRTSA